MRKWRGTVCAAAAVTLGLALATPASALVASWYTDDTEFFSGWACGDTDQVSLQVPRKAFAVAPVRPVLGTKLTDDGTGETDATITSIKRPRRDVTFTATGSDDVCANPDSYADLGWETNDVYFRVNFKTRERVLYPSFCDNPTYRPRRIVIACGDGNFYVDQIRWSWWGDRSARGVGTAHANDCVPYCAAGHFHSYPGVVVRLDNTRYCSDNSDYEFTRLRYRYTRARPPGFASSGSGLPGCAVIGTARSMRRGDAAASVSQRFPTGRLTGNAAVRSPRNQRTKGGFDA
jgi:hypothetical protein